jgi:mannose-6-phosphate isomerase-like protein (cupin superfamily)
MPRTLKLTPTESVTIRSSAPELLEVEAVYRPASKPPPKHLHPAQDEHFEVLAGQVRVRAGDQDRVLRQGDAFDILRGTAHQLWNPAGEEARIRWETRPAGRTEQWFEALDAIVSRTGAPPTPLTVGPLLAEYRDTFRLAIRPAVLERIAVTVLAAVGRLRR